jgi:N-acylglucosamine 2-epimerase
MGHEGYLAELRTFYHDQLTKNIMPFWAANVRDSECGGYHTCLDRNGSVYDYEKLCMWHAGRVIWTFSHLYNEFQQVPEWLEVAQWGLAFVQEHGFAKDGSMYYALTRQGQPLEPARDIYVELSTILGFTELARATGDEPLYQQAKALFQHVWEGVSMPGGAMQPFIAKTRPTRLHGHSMITLNVAQELRRYREESLYDNVITECIRRIVECHLKPNKKVILELVGWEGELLPGGKGRWVNPGHMIECGIFFIHEGQRRDDATLTKNGVRLIDWGFQCGWDKEFGGIFNDVDAEGLPVGTLESLQYDSKLWWQHAEALYGLMLAFCVTGEERFLDAYKQTHEYSFEKFADPEHGEWYGYLDRRGNPVNLSKGSDRKNPFHIARNFFGIWRLLGEHQA